MILQKDNLNVIINNTIFRSHNFVTPQFVFDPVALQGFYDGVGVKRQETPRPNQWGDFQEPGLFGPRTLSLTGTAVANNAKQLHAMRDEFMGLFVDGGYKEIEIQNSHESRYVVVSLLGNPGWKPQIDIAASWKLDLYAPDPRLYGPIQRAQLTDSTVSGGMDYPADYPTNYGGSVEVHATSLTNKGNAESWPRFEVTGDFYSGFSITNNAGKIIRYDGIVTTSAPVTIDTAKGTAVQYGVDKSTQLSRRDWFSIPARGSIQPMFLPTQAASGWCNIFYRDTWI